MDGTAGKQQPPHPDLTESFRWEDQSDESALLPFSPEGNWVSIKG